MPDGRRAFFAQTIEALYSTSELIGDDALSRFLDDGSVTVLRAQLQEDGTVRLSTALDTKPAASEVSGLCAVSGVRVRV